MSNNLVKYIEKLSSAQHVMLLEALLDYDVEVHSGSMWFVNRDTAISAMHQHLLKLKTPVSTKIKGMKYYEPRNATPEIKVCLALLEIIDGDNEKGR